MDTRKAGMAAGYLTSYCIFTFMLYLILSFSGRLPEGWFIPHAVMISGLISASGYGLRRWLS